jgi:hypothetical protein
MKIPKKLLAKLGATCADTAGMEDTFELIETAAQQPLAAIIAKCADATLPEKPAPASLQLQLAG